MSSIDVVTAPHGANCTVFLSGKPGSGKTTLAVQRLLYLRKQGVPPWQILVLTPQRTLASPYYEALRSASWPPGGQVDIATIGGLARRAIDLFWPLVAEPAGFSEPSRRPRFLTLETAQYHLDRVAEPFLSSGAFDGVTLTRSRLISQIIDDLNKAAAVGFPLEEIASRLGGAWKGESARLRIYEQVQAVALAFRRSCMAENLLDWSLQIEVFWRHLLALPQYRRYLLGGYRHLIVDNVEEDIPVTHDLLALWLPLCESALVVCDDDGGYRVFLGADPAGGRAVGKHCREHAVLTLSRVSTPETEALGKEMAGLFMPDGPEPGPDGRKALMLPPHPIHFHPEMLDWVADEISSLVAGQGTAPGDIAVLAPFVSDSLRFALRERLDRFGISMHSHRPSRQLREEPAARCLLTLVKLAHPDWRRAPHVADVSHAFAFAIADLDPARAWLLANVVYRIKDGHPTLAPFHSIVPGTQERLTYLLGGRYDELWRWVQRYISSIESAAGGAAEQPGAEGLDHFMSRLFGELLAQPGFGFHQNLTAAAVAANLIESMQKFRITFRGSGTSAAAGARLGQEYCDMVERGVIAAQYVSTWSLRSRDAVLLLPAYTFLMMNRPVPIQFWLDASSEAWFQRILQPLTHPYVLRRDWPAGQPWLDGDEVRVRNEAFARLVLGLTRRCSQRIYLAYCDLNERGYEQQGPLLQAVERMLRRRRGPVT